MTERRELLEILPDGNRLVRVTLPGRGLAGEDYTFITVESTHTLTAADADAIVEWNDGFQTHPSNQEERQD